MNAAALEVEFVAAAQDPLGLPAHGLPEAALLGRSNVGKSSLVNALAGGRPVARVSRTPGRTRSLNLYRISDRKIQAAIVDLPGYGYARVSKEERNRWKTVIERYLQRNQIRLAILILDARTGPTGLDRTMRDWLRARGLPFLATVTKIDKLGRSAARGALLEAARTLALDPRDVLPFSAVTREGVGETWKEIARRLSSAPPPSSSPSPP